MDEEHLDRLDDAALAALAAELAEREEHVSARRTSVHRRIDFLHAGGAGWADDATKTLVALAAQEQDLSDERHRLHARQQAVEAERSRRAAARPPAARERFV